MARILIVDDDKAFLKLLDTILKHHGFQVNQCVSGEEALKIVARDEPDLIMLDWLMPGMDGLATCQQLRRVTDVPIILLSGLSQEELIVDILESGADDHITKPFSISELVARINALLRLSSRSATRTTSWLTVGDVSIDVTHQTVLVRGQVVDLTPTEYKVLLLLVRNQGEVVPCRMLLLEGWGAEYADQLEYLHIYMRHLQQKIEKDADRPTIIERRQNLGYCICC